MTEAQEAEPLSLNLKFLEKYLATPSSFFFFFLMFSKLPSVITAAPKRHQWPLRSPLVRQAKGSCRPSISRKLRNEREKKKP